MRLPRRFDDALMGPPGTDAPVDAALLASLRAWCEGGADEPLRAASIAPHAGLDGVACALDGTHELARLGRWRGLAWRLQILVLESLMAGAKQPGAPWDCGWWREGPLAHAEMFRPRRATLLMVRGAAPAVAAALLSALRASSPAYDKPVRMLVVSEVAMAGVPRLLHSEITG